jgi:uncharacterized protein GlcG (DUF336 family)
MGASIRLALGALTLLIMSPTFAAGPFNDAPASPRSLPGDNLPPFGMLDEAGKLPPPPPLPPGGLHRGPGSPPESTAPGLSLDAATRVARAAVNSCAAQGYRVGVAVIDSVGEARVMLTANGSDGSHVFVAMRKAITALAFGKPSSAAHDLIGKDPTQIKRVSPAMFVEGGAVPIMRSGKLIGALGVSGAAGTPIGHQDEVCATAGLRALNGYPAKR